MRILEYNSSARGSGQFVRSLKIAEVITSAIPNASCLVLAGNSLADRRLPERTELKTMPQIGRSISGDCFLRPMKTAGARRLRSLSEAFAERKRIIESTIQNYDPDVFLVDSRPAGLNGELVEILTKMSARRTSKTVLLLRDIVDDPQLVVERWSGGIYKLIDEAYDKVLVLGDEHIFDAVQKYQMSGLREKVTYLGYLGSTSVVSSESNANKARGSPKHMLITVGGGYDGGSIIETVCQYISSRSAQDQKLSFSIVLGSNSPLSESCLIARYKGLSRTTKLYRHVRSLDRLIARADIVLSMCGYNTLMELIARKKRIIAVPRSHSGREQIIRASLLSRIYDGMQIIPQNELNVENVASSVDRALSAPPPAVQIEMNAATNLIAFLNREVER